MKNTMNLRPLLIAALMAPLLATAQAKFASRAGHIAFHSSTPMEDIDANNFKASSVIDQATGAVQIAVLMKGFEFKKALMQEHFNENYVESDKFPKGEFKGKITGMKPADFTRAGTYPVAAEGDLTLHGVTKPYKVEGTVVVDEAGLVKATTTFKVKPEDHGIEIPSLVRDNIAREIEVSVKIDHQKM